MYEQGPTLYHICHFPSCFISLLGLPSLLVEDSGCCDVDVHIVTWCISVCLHVCDGSLPVRVLSIEVATGDGLTEKNVIQLAVNQAVKWSVCLI